MSTHTTDFFVEVYKKKEGEEKKKDKEGGWGGAVHSTREGEAAAEE